MLNILAQSRTDSGIQNALALIEGHFKFMNYNTGLTIDPKLQHYIANPDGVLSNNRHYIAETQMEYQPNGDGTTEGQSLQVLGYCYVYLATMDQRYLDKAIWHWDAYKEHFYAGDPIPETPQRWIANWLANSKEPCLSNWPVNASAPTQGGYKCVPLQFVNGQAQIPHGSPFWGEYLDVLTFAHRGHMTWDAINGSVQKIDNDIDWDQVYAYRVTEMPETPTDSMAWVDWEAYLGAGGYTVDWNTRIPELQANWVNVWTGNKIGVGTGPDDQLWNGDIIETDIPFADIGKFQLADDSVNGVYFVNYAVRLPVDKGGYMFDRNEVWHNRPIHTPLLGTANQRGNAADGEEWFADACFLLWKITGEEHYKKALDSCLFTNLEYTSIDSADRFFRQDTQAHTPFTDGISYDFTYPSGSPVTYGRDADGYITIETDSDATVSLEQQAVWFRVDQGSSLRTVYGGLGKDGSPVSLAPRLVMNMDKRGTTGDTIWTAPLPPSTSNVVHQVDTPMNQFVLETKSDGSEYILADMRAISHADAIVSSAVYEENILDGRNAIVVRAFFPDDDPWFSIGNWLQPDGKAPLTSITYKADADFNLRFADDDKWRWWWMLPDTNGEWVTLNIDKNDATFSGYQPDADGRPEPAAPIYTEVEEFNILFDNSSTVNATFSYYCLNEIPPRYLAEDGYTMNFRVTISSQDASGMEVRLGDCTIVDFRDDSLAYTPGVIPFSNIYEEGSDQIGAWHGMPYPGYQYPFIYTLDSEKYSRQLENMINFLYDAQDFYATTIGVMGPVASAYVWDRWDNYKYGTPDTFTMYHWGDGNAWSGYQPRAFQGACRAWQELVYQGKPIPPKLITYVNRWITFLGEFIAANEGRTPTGFSATLPPTAPSDDFTGHMCGLWLAGATQAAMAGCDNPNLTFVIESCLTELTDNYINTGIPSQIMNGSWSPAVRESTGNGIESNGMFFGFWSGEILRALGSYILYKTKDPLTPLY